MKLTLKNGSPILPKEESLSTKHLWIGSVFFIFIFIIILFYFILFYFILFYFILFYLFYFIFSILFLFPNILFSSSSKHRFLEAFPFITLGHIQNALGMAEAVAGVCVAPISLPTSLVYVEKSLFLLSLPSIFSPLLFIHFSV